MVVLYHYVAVPISPEAEGLLGFLRRAFSKGWSGVDLFFVLSGFLIGRNLLWYRNAVNYYGVFYLRRMARIFPLYYVFLGLFVFLRWVSQRTGWLSPELFMSPYPLWPYFVYLQNLFMIFHGTFGNEILAVTWSLSVEEQFYLFLPWLLRMSAPARLLPHILFFLFLPLFLRWTLGGPGTFYGYVFTPWRFDASFLGVLLAFLEVRHPHLLDRLRPYRWVLRWLFFGMLILFVVQSFQEPLGSLDHLFFLALFYGTLLLLLLVRDEGFLGVFQHPGLRRLGLISYSVYLFHQLVNFFLHDVFFGQVPRFQDANTIAVTLLAFGLTLGVALVTYRFIEKPWMAWGHRFKYRYRRTRTVEGRWSLTRGGSSMGQRV